MSIFNKSKVKTAVDSSTNLKFRSTHLTTMDFFQTGASYVRALVPKQSINVKMSCFSRLAPLPVPTLGRVKFKHHAFFVPYRTIMYAWDDFITDTPHQAFNSSDNGIVPFAHRLSVKELTQVFLQHFLYEVPDPQQIATDTYPLQNPAADFIIKTGSGDSIITKYYGLNTQGRPVYRLLRQLGYDLTSDCTQESSDTYLSALPLLAFTRCYIDWYYPSQYVGDVGYNTLKSVLQHDSSSGYTLTSNDLYTILIYVRRICYEQDYFVSAFDRPTGPNQGLYSTFNIPDISMTSASDKIPTVSTGGSNYYNGTSTSSTAQIQGTQNFTGGTPHIRTVSNPDGSATFGAMAGISQYILDQLKNLTDYMKRHQLVGSRALERYLARFGVNLPDTHTAYLIGSFEQDVDFGAVMSNAATSQAAIGDYAGQGVSFNNGNFQFENSDEYGIFLIITSVVPQIGYVDGIDRHLLHLSKLDFWTPEFDGNGGNQAISRSELFSNVRFPYVNNTTGKPSFKSETTLQSLVDKVFGFTPRYSEYKIQLDKMTGDFSLHSKSQAGLTSDSWHLFRLIQNSNALPVSAANLLHDKDFVLGEQFDSEYDRIFGNTSGAADHFVLQFNFDVESRFPGRSLYDTYDFESAGKQIDIEAGGLQIN